MRLCYHGLLYVAAAGLFDERVEERVTAATPRIFHD